MDRKKFLKNTLGLAGVAAISPILLKSEIFNNPETQSAEKSAMSCSVTNTETEGPFPTLSPSTLVQSNIVGGRTGVAFTINIYINNVNANCAAYQGVLVDIWHCDKDGNYSEYGGTPMQSTNYTAYHFLRGRQTTDANGLVSFTSIFPGWYQSRATHIHVHIYKADGTSLLITQIAFPEGTNSAVYNVNVNGTSYGYTKGMTGYTYNATDNVFSDGTSNEMSTVTGSLSAGYVLTHTIYVAGAALSTNEVKNSDKNFSVGSNYPNPFKDETTFPINLKESSLISIDIIDMSGRKISKIIDKKRFEAGKNEIKMERNGLPTGNYFAIIQVENSNGNSTESVKINIQ